MHFFHLPRGAFQKFSTAPFSCGLNPGPWHHPREETHLFWHLGTSYLVPGSECMEQGFADRHAVVILHTLRTHGGGGYPSLWGRPIVITLDSSPAGSEV